MLKRTLGKLPLTAEMMQILKPISGELPCGYRLDRMEEVLPEWISSVEDARERIDPYQPRNVLIIASLRWWLEYCTALGLLLTGLGHHVDIAYLPYRTWWEPADALDLRRHRLYLRHTLAPLKRLIGLRDVSTNPAGGLSDKIRKSVEEQCRIDVQYTLQR